MTVPGRADQKKTFMNKIKKILAPTDLSELSKVGLRPALEMAESQGAEVIVYHVVGLFEEWLARHNEFSSVAQLIEKREQMLARFLKKSFADLLSQVSVREEVEGGVPYKMIVEKAGEEAVDIIVMSTHGWSGLSHMFIGSVTEKVVARATCPVLSIRPPKEPDLARAVGGSEQS